MNIKALHFGLTNYRTDAYIAWHPARSLTWRWTFTIGFKFYKFWFRPRLNWWHNSLNGAVNCSAFWFCMHLNWQPEIDRATAGDWRKQMAETQARERQEEINTALKEREGARLQ